MDDDFIFKKKGATERHQPGPTDFAGVDARAGEAPVSTSSIQHGGYSTEVWTNKAIEYLEAHSKTMHRHEQPFAQTGPRPGVLERRSSRNGTPDHLRRKAHGDFNDSTSRTPAFLYLAYNGVHGANWNEPLEAPTKYTAPFVATIPCAGRTGFNMTMCIDRRTLAGMIAAVCVCVCFFFSSLSFLFLFPVSYSLFHLSCLPLPSLAWPGLAWPGLP